MGLSDALAGRLLRVGLTLLDRRRVPRTSGALELQGLHGPVEVLRDRWGVPHIYAADDHDLYMAQGFVHAQERLWQMELLRRTASGRLSEVFGELSLDTDRATRTFGFARLGRGDWEQAAPETVEAVTAYCEGINAYLSSPDYPRQRPVEFTLLRHEPEPWRPEDTATVARLILWRLSHAWYSEIVRARIAEVVGAERLAEIDVQYPGQNPVVLPQGIIFNRLGEGGILEAVQGPFLSRGLGSNGWAIAPQRSATGHPLLCNDMHLDLSTPGLWYLSHQEAKGLQVSGATLPGTPFVLVGHNARVAWGMTLAFTDCEDLFVERFEPGSTRYQFRDGWREAEVLSEPIAVKGRGEPHVEQVVVTHHGPVISDVVGVAEQRLTVQSMALRPSQALAGWLQLNRASGWDAFVAALRCVNATQLSVTYADTEGNIGYWVTGAVPVRASGRGMVPAEGWTGEAEWVGEVPFEEMPHALNPVEGLVVNANNRIVDDDYPHFLGNAWMNGFRARRLIEVLRSRAPFSAADARELQMDLVTVACGDLMSHLQDIEPSEPELRDLLDRLRNWDGHLTADSTAGAIYEVFRVALVRNLLEPALGPELSLQWMGQGFHPLLLSVSELHGYDFVAVLRLLDDSDSWWVQQAGGRQNWIEKSLAETAAWLRQELGTDPDRWQWGRLHRTSFPHALGASPVLDLALGRGNFAVGGDSDTPCQFAFKPERPYDNYGAAATFRQIVDLGDLSQSLVLVPPGQSGHPGSPHYDDMIDPWLKGEYIPMLWTRTQVEREAQAILVLEPVADHDGDSEGGGESEPR